MRNTSGFSRMAPTIASLRASRYVVSPLGINVLQRRFGFGVGVSRGLLEGLLYALLHPLFQVPPLALLQGALLLEDGGEALYRVALAPRRDLLAGAVEVRVALGVAEVAVGDRLQERRPLPRPGPLEGGGGRLADLVEVRARDRDARHPVGGGAVRDVLDGRGLLDAHGHPVLVVLAEKADGRVVLAAPLEGPRRAANYAHAPADDAVGAEHPSPYVGYVHGAALAVAVPGRLAQELGGHAVHVEAEGYGVPVAAVGGGDHVPLLERRDGPNGDGLLSHVEVRRPVDLAFGVEVVHLLVEVAAQ